MCLGFLKVGVTLGLLKVVVTLGLLKVGVTWFPQGCSDSWSSQGCSDSWSSQGCCDWEKNLGHWLPTTVAGSCSPGKVFLTDSPSSFYIHSPS